uniref:Uncharacterized protein n=1 Tax=Romanomermis culicivorax TaxID=13658 RepID=A0A915I781_ROMCU
MVDAEVGAKLLSKITEDSFTLFNKFFLCDRDSLMITFFNYFEVIEIDFLIPSKAAFVETQTATSIVLK